MRNVAAWRGDRSIKFREDFAWSMAAPRNVAAKWDAPSVVQQEREEFVRSMANRNAADGRGWRTIA